MAEIQVTCIHKTSRIDPHEGITHLGNFSGKWTKYEVIDWIERDVHTFFTVVKGRRFYIGVVITQNGKYLRCYADGAWNDHLLALPECP